MKLAEVRTFADCAKYILTTLLRLCKPAPNHIKDSYKTLFQTENFDLKTKDGRQQFKDTFKNLLEEWSPLLFKFLRNEEDQVILNFIN